MLLLVLVAALLALFGGSWLALRRGFSAREKPSALEAFVARRVRVLGIPVRDRQAVNPVAASAEVLGRARAHFADHCAICHGNDGSGETAIGRNLYPKAPDMRQQATQSLSDGQIFWIIKNGVRLSGMPAWGSDTAEDDRESWGLVHFIRHLPSISPNELAEMRALNPKSREKLEEEAAERKFLEEGAPPPRSEPTQRHRH